MPPPAPLPPLAHWNPVLTTNITNHPARSVLPGTTQLTVSQQLNNVRTRKVANMWRAHLQTHIEEDNLFVFSRTPGSEPLGLTPVACKNIRRTNNTLLLLNKKVLSILSLENGKLAAVCYFTRPTPKNERIRKQ